MPQNKKKKLAILGAPLDNQKAGIHIYTKGLADSLHQQAELPFDVILFRLKKTGDYPRFKTIVIPILSWIPGLMAFRMFFIIPLVCRWLKVDMVLEPAHFGPFNLPKKVKRITVIHDLTPILFPQWHTFQGWFLQKLFLKKICRRADLILTVSDHTKSDIVTHFKISPDKITRIYPGISDIFKPTRDNTILQKYGLTKPYFLTVGTIEPRKNHSLILKAFESYKTKTNAPDQLAIAGGLGWKMKSLMQDIESHPYRKDIILTGYVPEGDLPGLYTQCKAFIFASHYEGFGLPVVEASACGAASYVALNSSLTELNNPLIRYFDHLDELSYLIESEPNNFSLNELTIINEGLQEKFSWHKCICEFIPAFKSIA